MDGELQALERAVKEAPDDAKAVDAVERARVRAGLGWHGEKLPEADCGCCLCPAAERGVYELRLRPQADVRIALQLVYVPAGDRECGLAVHAASLLVGGYPLIQSTAPVVLPDPMPRYERNSGFLVPAPLRMVPARPLGVSWCGAHDMAGNVEEWVLTGPETPQRHRAQGRDDRFFTAIGGSYRSTLSDEWPRSVDHLGREYIRTEGESDVGFRVALDASS